MNRLSVFLLLFFAIGKVFSQTPQSRVSEIWEKLLYSDDYEKNYRLPSFLDVLSENVFMNNENVPFGWIYEKMPETDYHFFSGILPFSHQNSLLIWILSSEEENESYIFTKELDISFIPDINLSVVFESDQALSIYNNDKKYVEIPDIQVKILFSKLRYDIPDSEKEEISRKIWERLKKLLDDKFLFDNDFSNFERLSTVISADKKVKICTWNIEYSNGEHSFYGGLVINNSSNPKVFELKDERKSINNPLESVLTYENWWGCIYYNIIENKYKETTYYTLIGYNGNNAFSQIKLVDILTFTDNQNPVPKFGMILFTDKYKNNQRLIFEYSKNATMILRYDSNVNMIVMDNLSPTSPFFQNDFRFYGPDFSYNGLKFENGKWVYFDDIDLRN